MKFKCKKRQKVEINGEPAFLCGTKMESEDHCNHCCLECAHALEMECTFVCSQVASYYYPEEDETLPQIRTLPWWIKVYARLFPKTVITSCDISTGQDHTATTRAIKFNGKVYILSIDCSPPLLEEGGAE